MGPIMLLSFYRNVQVPCVTLVFAFRISMKKVAYKKSFGMFHIWLIIFCCCLSVYDMVIIGFIRFCHLHFVEMYLHYLVFIWFYLRESYDILDSYVFWDIIFVFSSKHILCELTWKVCVSL